MIQQRCRHFGGAATTGEVAAAPPRSARFLRRHLATRTHAASSTASDAAEARLLQLFSCMPVLTLERATGERAGADAAPWQGGAFAAEVYPDLPVPTTWHELLPWRLGSSSSSHASSSSSFSSSSISVDGAGGDQALQQQQEQQSWRVQTVACQLRGMAQLRQLLVDAAGGSWPAGVGRPADALLCVSGSHPLRMLPGADALLRSSFDTLRLASDMRARGELPAALSLWAVENPMRDPASRMAAKADAGAEVVLTQPPLLWDQSAAWAEAAAAAGTPSRLRLVVGIPMASSAGNLDFWLRLAGVRSLPEAEALLAAFPSEPAAVLEWNADLVRRTLALPGVAGLHVMPLTKTARKMTQQLLEQGVLPGHAAAASTQQQREPTWG